MDMVYTTDEKILLGYVKAIKHATTEELKDLDNEITWNDDLTIRGYALLMNVIDMRKEMLK